MVLVVCTNALPQQGYNNYNSNQINRVPQLQNRQQVQQQVHIYIHDKDTFYKICENKLYIRAEMFQIAIPHDIHQMSFGRE